MATVMICRFTTHGKAGFLLYTGHACRILADFYHTEIHGISSLETTNSDGKHSGKSFLDLGRQNEDRRQEVDLQKRKVENLPSQIYLTTHARFKNIPPIKGILIDKFNLENMVFGELESKSHTDEIIGFANEISDQVDQLPKLSAASTTDLVVATKDTSLIVSKERELFDEQLQWARLSGLMALSVPQDYGGLELSPLRTVRMLEAVGKNLPLGLVIAIHNVWVCKGISLMGSELQRNRYLPRLADGSLIGSVCLPYDMDTTPGGLPRRLWKTASTNSQKPPVLNGHCGSGWMQTNADGLLLCVPDHIDDNVDYSGSMHPFLTETSSMAPLGLSLSQLPMCGLSPLSKQSLSARDSPIEASMSLDASSVDALGYLISEESYAIMSVVCGRLRYLIDETIQRCTGQMAFGMHLSQFSSVQAALFECQTRLFALQSTVYYLAGLAERGTLNISFEADLVMHYGPMLALEIVEWLSKVAGSDARFILHDNECLEKTRADIWNMQYILGDRSVMWRRLSSHFRQVMANEDPRNDIRLINKGVKYENFFGKSRRGILRKLKRLSENECLNNPDSLRVRGPMSYRLYEYAHPCLYRSSMLVEHSAVYLSTAARFACAEGERRLIESKDRDIADQWELTRRITVEPVAHAAFNVLMMLSSVSRASRSRSIGAMNCDEEVSCADTVCEALNKEVERELEICFSAQEVFLVRPPPFNINYKYLYPNHPLDMS